MLKDGQKVYLQRPVLQNLNSPAEEEIVVYPLKKEVIRDVVNDDIKCGNYLLGEIEGERWFSVFYAGRSTERKLKERIAEHVGIHMDYPNAYFAFQEKATEEDAYHQECKDFHDFYDIDGYFINKSHPSKPSGKFIKCKICNL